MKIFDVDNQIRMRENVSSEEIAELKEKLSLEYTWEDSLDMHGDLCLDEDEYEEAKFILEHFRQRVNHKKLMKS